MNQENKVLESFNLGLYNKAISYYKDEISLDQASNRLINIIAACFFKLGEYSEAQLLLDRLAPFLSEDASFLSLYASNSRLQGEYEKSESLFLSALKIDSKSPQVRNNYANLLIDMKKYDQAREILVSLLSSDPNYSDARTNLNRLSFVQSSLSADSQKQNSDLTPDATGYSLADPLLLAFADREINFARKRYKLNASPDAKRVLSHLNNTNSKNSHSEQLSLAKKSLEDKNFEFSLKICSQLISSGFVHADVYDCVSDAYLNLNRLRESEICLLHALSIGGGTPKRFLNLVSFACMRFDYELAHFYLERAAQIDPSHPQLQAIAKQVESQKTKSQHIHSFSDNWPQPSLKS